MDYKPLSLSLYIYNAKTLPELKILIFFLFCMLFLKKKKKSN